MLTSCIQLKLTGSDGGAYKTDCDNTEGAFRIIQSIPTPKAEPFKRRLAQVGYERVQKVENPEVVKSLRTTVGAWHRGAIPVMDQPVLSPCGFHVQ